MSQPRSSDDGGPHQPGDGDPAGLPPLPAGWAELVIPDDPRDLAAEAIIVRAELELDPRWPGRARQRLPLAGPTVALAIMLIVAISSLLMAISPMAKEPPTPAPLAASAELPGTVGGLLPDVELLDAHRVPVALRSVRPTMLLLVPDACDCRDQTDQLVRASRASLVQVELIGASHHPALPDGVSQAQTLLDPDGVLASSLTPREAPWTLDGAVTVTAVLVRSDGVIARILQDPHAGSDLESDLAGLTIR